MKKPGLTAAAVFLTAFLGAGRTHAQHNHGGGQAMPQSSADQARVAAQMCPLSMKIFEPALKNTESGVEITLTAKDIKNIAKLRELAARHFSSKEEMDKNCPASVSGAKTSVEETEGGVKITITAQFPAAIKTVQAAAAHACKREISVTKRIFKTYACPMGEYQGSKPGKCPKCGMELMEKK